MRRVLAKLVENFAVVHVHGNNFSPIFNIANVIVPDVLEVTFANRARYTCTDTDEIFPTPLDRPCAPKGAEIHLGCFRY